jgi:hypothetical protein
MPQPAVVCQGLLDAAAATLNAQFPTAEEGKNFELPFSMEQAPNFSRYNSILYDLSVQKPGDRVYVFVADGKEESDQFVSATLKSIDSRDKDAKEMTLVTHFMSVVLMGQPVAVWAKEHMGKNRAKGSSYFAGWTGLASIFAGAVLFVTNNPVVNLDRFLYLALTNDRQIMNQVKELQASLSDPNASPAHHLSRDLTLTEHFWSGVYGSDSPRLNVRPSFQVLADSSSLYERLFRFLFSPFRKKPNHPKESLQVKLDLMTNSQTGKSMLLLRTHPL